MAVTIKKAPSKGKGAVQTLAKASVDTGKAFKRIYDMTPDQQAAMNAMFYEGKSVGDIMNMLRTGYGLFKDVNDNTFSRYLYRYKWQVTDKHLAVMGAKSSPEEQKAAVALVESLKEIDIVQELTELIHVQKTRVKKLLVREKDMPMLFNSLGGEMKTLAGFVQQYADHAFELGILKRVPKITKISQNGQESVIESEGREQLMVSIEQKQHVEKAAQKFYEALALVEGDNVQSL